MLMAQQVNAITQYDLEIGYLWKSVDVLEKVSIEFFASVRCSIALTGPSPSFSYVL